MAASYAPEEKVYFFIEAKKLIEFVLNRTLTTEEWFDMITYIVATAKVPNFRAQVRYIDYFLQFYTKGRIVADFLIKLVEKIESYAPCVPQPEAQQDTKSDPDQDPPADMISLIDALTSLFSISDVYFTHQDDFFTEDHQSFPNPQ